MPETRAQREARRGASRSPRGGKEICYTGGQGPFVNGPSKEEQDKRVLQLGAHGESENKGSGLAIAIYATQVTHQA